VSHQVKQLEADCGLRLFHRKPRQVDLTPQGATLAKSIEPALDAMATAFARLSIGQGRSNVTLGAGPIFASRWLVPRLGAFWNAHPDIDLWVHHSPLPVWKQMTRFDVAVAWGSGTWPGVESTPLLRIRVSPVHAPALRGAGVGGPGGILDLPLLHYRNDRGWRQWLHAAGVADPGELPGTVFEDANVLLQATLAGRGASLGILGFIEDELSSGRLVQPFIQSVDPGDAYHLVWRTSALSEDAVAKVRNWLLGEADTGRS
jgi:LysR family glycine cleavage system transcriptional activator